MVLRAVLLMIKGPLRPFEEIFPQKEEAAFAEACLLVLESELYDRTIGLEKQWKVRDCPSPERRVAAISYIQYLLSTYYSQVSVKGVGRRETTKKAHLLSPLGATTHPKVSNVFFQ